jgi:hypothetical protein
MYQWAIVAPLLLVLSVSRCVTALDGEFDARLVGHLQ